MENILSYFKGKNILVTGHTGFKGTYLCRALCLAGANVTGYALEPPTSPSVFELTNTQKLMHSVIGDVRDFDLLKEVFQKAQPQIVFHLAAQPLVRESYNNPRYTYETNVMGTVNVCECVRLTDSVKSFVNVTTDKVYCNNDSDVAFKEDMMLNGYDPYSNSKSCSELVTSSYFLSFLKAQGVAVSTARAGNVIGGGDFAKDRIVPDCVRCALDGEPILVRSPNSTRPYQYVLEPIKAYLMIAKAQLQNSELQGAYNVGPNDDCNITTGELATTFCRLWQGAVWQSNEQQNAPHEAAFLRLNNSKICTKIGWIPSLSFETAMKMTTAWYQALYNGENISDFTDKQIKQYFWGK